MTAHSSDTREPREDEDDEARTHTRRAASTIASVNENGRLSALLGGVLLAGSARSLTQSKRRGRASVQAMAGAALLAVGLRQRRAGGGTKAESASDDAHAGRERGDVQEGENPRGTSGEPDVEVENQGGNVEFSEEQDVGPNNQPDLEDEADVEDPRRDHGDETEIDISEASMADEASEAVGPSSTQAQPAQTDDTEPERTAEAGDSSTDDDSTAGSEDEPEPDADPGEATEAAEDADPENVADEIIEDEIDDEDREGVETEGGATVHTDTNEADNMDIDVDDVTDADDDLNTEADESDQQSSSHLDEDPPDEDEAE